METIQTNSIKAWILAARPKTLAAAATPVLLGCALAYTDGAFQWIPAILCFLFAFSMQIDANFINDYYDYLKGSDREDRLGPERACAQGWITLSAMKKGMIITTLLSCFWGLLLLRYCGLEMIPEACCAYFSPSSIQPVLILWLIMVGGMCWSSYSSASSQWDVRTTPWHTTGRGMSPSPVLLVDWSPTYY